MDRKNVFMAGALIVIFLSVVFFSGVIVFKSRKTVKYSYAAQRDTDLQLSDEINVF